MIEQIKEALPEIESHLSISTVDYLRDVRYLIGEVERLEREFQHSQNNMKMAVSSMELKDRQVSELQKALEIVYGIACEEFESVNQMELIRLTASESLERNKP
jgi:hypothetical protein